MISRADIARAYEAHRAGLLRALSTRAGADAEDIVHDAFLRLLASAHRIDDPDHLGPLLRVIARNGRLSRMRHQDVATFSDELPSPHGCVAARQELARLSTALDSASRTSTEAFRLIVLEELSEAAAAKRLGVSTATAQRDLARAWQAIDEAGVRPEAR